jgi:hypothetical protein
MKYTLLLFCIFLVIQGYSQKNKDAIIWGEKEIEWKDFKGKPEKKSHFQALTHSEMHAPNSWNRDSLHINVFSKFVKSKSWTKNKESANLLKHEQLHFDITEYHTRLFRKAILRYKFSSHEQVGNEVVSLFNKYHKKSRTMQSLYDKESDHSRDAKGQDKWNKKVALLLTKTNEYTMTQLDIYIGYIK